MDHHQQKMQPLTTCPVMTAEIMGASFSTRILDFTFWENQCGNINQYFDEIMEYA